MKCNEFTKPCFAKRELNCTILQGKSYPAGKCPFRKPKQEMTNGVEYAYDPKYVSTKKETVTK